MRRGIKTVDMLVCDFTSRGGLIVAEIICSFVHSFFCFFVSSMLVLKLVKLHLSCRKIGYVKKEKNKKYIAVQGNDLVGKDEFKESFQGKILLSSGLSAGKN